MNNAKNIQEEMKSAAESIIDRVQSGQSVNASDRKFLKSWLSLVGGKNAFNAGKRKIIKTGK